MIQPVADFAGYALFLIVGLYVGYFIHDYQMTKSRKYVDVIDVWCTKGDQSLHLGYRYLLISDGDNTTEVYEPHAVMGTDDVPKYFTDVPPADREERPWMH